MFPKSTKDCTTMLFFLRNNPTKICNYRPLVKKNRRTFGFPIGTKIHIKNITACPPNSYLSHNPFLQQIVEVNHSQIRIAIGYNKLGDAIFFHFLECFDS